MPVDSRVAAAADEKVMRALNHIEAAQYRLDKACQELSSIIGGAQQYERAGKLHRQIELHWHRLNEWARKHRGKLDLDEGGRRELARAASPTTPKES